MRAPVAENKIYVKAGYTDLRKGACGLAVMVEEEMGEKPLSGHIFVFCNKNRTLLKALWWDKTGFWLCQKRLEKQKWPWPENEETATLITEDELNLLLRGIDFWKAHKEVYYTSVS